jgi:hypothetical protein
VRVGLPSSVFPVEVSNLVQHVQVILLPSRHQLANLVAGIRLARERQVNVWVVPTGKAIEESVDCSFTSARVPPRFCTAHFPALNIISP